MDSTGSINQCSFTVCRYLYLFNHPLPTTLSSDECQWRLEATHSITETANLIFYPQATYSWNTGLPQYLRLWSTVILVVAWLFSDIGYSRQEDSFSTQGHTLAALPFVMFSLLCAYLWPTFPFWFPWTLSSKQAQLQIPVYQLKKPAEKKPWRAGWNSEWRIIMS